LDDIKEWFEKYPNGVASGLIENINLFSI